MMKDIEIKISRETRMVDLSKTTIGNDGENLQGNLVFSFTDEFVKGQGRLEYVINGESKYAFLLSGDENYYIPIKSVMTKEGQIDMQLVITEGTDVNEIPIFKSNVFYVSCKKSINAEVEEEEGYYSWIEIANTKLNEVDEAIEELASQSDYAKEQGDYAKSEGDNAKSVAEETEKKAQEGAFDGKSLEFVWEGTKLGVRLEGQEEYHFVDLQGKQGEIGATGEPFKIKKTYGSVSEMNADFGNMQFGDYVMIASSVEVEDNAKLYTRGESAWIFISDFSGAMGIRGETGLTPNIQIGSVQTLEAGSQASVTRSGTDENPLLNFAIPKGDKGDDYVLTEEDKVEIGKKVNTEYEERIEQNEQYISELEATIDILTNTDTKKGELVHITDALGLPTFENKISGNVKQETTRGVNILNWNISGSETSNGITRTYITPTEINFKGKVENKSNSIFGISLGTLEAGTYTISFTNHDSTKLHYLISNVGNISSIYKTFTLSEIGDRYLQVYCDTEDTIDITIKFQLETGDKATPYEPFTNGASPNPEYPQEIEVLEGYNLFDKNNANVIDGYISGSSATKIEASSYGKIIYIKCEPNTSYSISKLANRFFMASSSEIPQVNKNIENVVNGGDTSTEYNNYVTSANAKYLILYCYYLLNASFSFEEMLDSIQIVKGKEAKLYLPYGCVGYKVNGKNLFNDNKFVNDNFDNIVEVENGYTFDVAKSENVYIVEKAKPNTQYTFKGKITGLTGVNLSITFKYTDGTTKYAYELLKQDNSENSFKLTTDETKTLSSIITKFYSQGTYKTYTFQDFMLSEEDDTYEPYQEQIVYLDLKGNWVGAINDTIKDYLVTDKKKYWLVKNVGKVVLDGSESWTLNGGTTDYGQYMNTSSTPDKAYGKINIISDKFISKYSNDSNSIAGRDVNSNIFITIAKSIVPFDVNAFKTWLSNNNVEVYYQLAEPQTVYLGELPEPIKTFEGTNNIQVLANLDTEIEVKYALDVKKYFENKLASIQEQIL